MKKQLARIAVRLLLRTLVNHPNPTDRLLGQAVRLQLGYISDDRFRWELANYYRNIDPQCLHKEIDYSAKAARLRQPGGYKASMNGPSPDSAGPLGRRWLWARRYGLLRHLGIRVDLLVLRKGETIPPHAHRHVASGFYVVDGRVGVRQYDRVREEAGTLVIRKAVDEVQGPGDFSTESEYVRNVHWLEGMAPASFLYRVTVVDTPTRAFGGPGGSDDRLYVDPTGSPDESGLIAAPYIDEAAARRLRFEPTGVAVPPAELATDCDLRPASCV